MALKFLKITVKPKKHIKCEVFPPQMKTKTDFSQRVSLVIDVRFDGAISPPFVSPSPNSGEFPTLSSLLALPHCFTLQLASGS